MAKKIFAQDPVKFIPALAEALKAIPEIETPEWAHFVKSSASRERPPAEEDFWYTRAASILRQLYIKGVVGVGKFRTRYGSRKGRGGKPSEFRKAGGKIIRVILQQVEAAGLVEKLSKLQFGRRLTQKGRDLLDSIEVEEKKGFDISNVLVETRPIEQEIGEESEEINGETENGKQKSEE
jgi:small subunit ribosomal protein S19e